MVHPKIKQITFSFLFFTMLNPVLYAQNKVKLTVEFSNVESEEGEIFAQIIEADETIHSSHKLDAKEGAQLVIEGLSPGTYRVRVFQDLNGNEEMDKNFMGIPREPYGFSNNVKPNMGPPDKDKMFFKIREDKKIEILLQ